MKDRYTELAELIHHNVYEKEGELFGAKEHIDVIASTIRAHLEEQPDNRANLESAAQQFQKELLENSKQLPAECQMTDEKFWDIIGEEQPDEGMEARAIRFANTTEDVQALKDELSKLRLQGWRVKLSDADVWDIADELCSELSTQIRESFPSGTVPLAYKFLLNKLNQNQ